MDAEGLIFPIIFFPSMGELKLVFISKRKLNKTLKFITKNNSQSKTLTKVQLSWKVIKGASFNTGSSYSYLWALTHLCSSRQISFNFHDIHVILCTYLNPEIQKWEEMWCLSVLWRQTCFIYYDDFRLHPLSWKWYNLFFIPEKILPCVCPTFSFSVPLLSDAQVVSITQ